MSTVPTPPKQTKAERLVGRLVSAGVILGSDRGDLTYVGPAKVVDADALEELRRSKHDVMSLLDRLTERGVRGLAPTTHEQRRMELRHRADRNSAGYNICLRFDLAPSVEPSRLERAITSLVDRHETLRTRYEWFGDHLLQVVCAPPRDVVQYIPRSTLAGATEAQVDAWCRRRGAAAFDLSQSVPVRWCLAARDDGGSLLLVTMQHIAADGWSIDLLGRDLRALYRSDAAEVASPQMTPSEFARWELGWLSEERMTRERAYWAEELATAWHHPLAAQNGQVPVSGGDAFSVRRQLPNPVCEAVEALAAAESMTPFSVYFAAYAQLIYDTVGRDDFLTVIAVANRTRPEHESVAGLCRNALPIRCEVSVEYSLTDIAQQLNRRVARALDHQTIPLDVVMRPVIEPGTTPRVPFTFGLEEGGEAAPFGRSVSVRDVYVGAARTDLSLLVRRGQSTTEVVFEFATELFTEARAEEVTERYVELCTGLVE